jgi:hypothetical protein
MVETLNKKLEHKGDLGNFPSLQITRGVNNLNHSQFTDDTLLLRGALVITATRFKRTLDSILDASGGDVNNVKCQVY